MKIAIRYEIPSLEADFVASVFEGHEVQKFLEWESSNALDRLFDIAICIGPVTKWIPQARCKILLILGPVDQHQDFDFDIIIVTSEIALDKSIRRFGHLKKYRIIEPAILGINAGSRRIVAERKTFLHLSSKNYDDTPRVDNIEMMQVWSGNIWPIFKALDFNSLVKGGAVGIYMESEGYDLQIRRHLSLGGSVFCLDDMSGMGEWSKFVEKDSPSLSVGRINPIDCIGDEEQYAKELKSLLRIL